MSDTASDARRGGREAWEALLRTHAAVLPRIAGEVEAATGLPLSWYDVLLELGRDPQRRLRMRELGSRVVLSRSRVSRVVDEMVAAGLVERIPDERDARAVLACMTPAGLRAFRRSAPAYLRAIDRHFAAQLAPGELEAIATGLRRVLEIDERAGSPEPGSD